MVVFMGGDFPPARAGRHRGSADEKAADDSNREELRQPWKTLTPEERRAKIRELRQTNTTGRDGKRRATFARLTPAERAARLKELGIDVEQLKKLPPAERQKELRQLAVKRLAELRKKKTDGTLTVEEEKQLVRGEAIGKRFGRPDATGGEGGKSGPASGDSAPTDKK